ncbi:MAG: cyclic nucleotide-binding domain-containing protein [Gammaproteobacteria bacterium]|nr:cyclic nucleotide-binding domain-containing protein [Gammaproteobacteria bacterium]
MTNIHSLFQNNNIFAEDTQVDAALVRNSSLGEELTIDESRTLAGIMGVHHLNSGELLSSNGDTHTTLFVLAKGKLVITRDGDNSAASGEKVVYTMSPGECAGRRAFVEQKPRQATLRAATNAVVYTLEPESFELLLSSHPHLVYKVMRALFKVTHNNLMRMNMETEQLSNYIIRSNGRY